MFAKRTIARFAFALAILASLFFSNLGIAPVYAAGITVNTNVDEVTTNGKCSLREAIINANNNAATHPDCATAFGIDTITFAGNYTITLAGAQLPAVTSTIIINGKGAANTIIQANASPNTATHRVFEVSGSLGNLTLDSLTVRHGRCVGGCQSSGSHGGGIYKGANAYLTISNSTISGNAAHNGGGIYNGIDSGLTITNSAISGNSATDFGGGIYNYYNTLTMTNSAISGNSATNGGGIFNNTGTVTMTNGSISGNSATNGGGIYSNGIVTVANVSVSGNMVTGNGGGIYNSNAAGDLTLTNSSISGNSASAGGGGIYNAVNKNLGIYNSAVYGNDAGTGGGIANYGNMWLGNATISGNEAYDYGGGIYSDGSAWIHNSTIAFNVLIEGTSFGAGGIDGDVALYNTLVAGNSRALTSEYRDCSGTLYLEGVNIFWDLTNCSINPASPGFHANLFSLSELGPLQNNGGPTWTHALIPIAEGTRAIDAGDNTLCANWPINNVDQRGKKRPQGGNCDVGAYEAPVTATFKSVAAQDGWILESTETSGVGGSSNASATTFNLGDGAADKQYRAILSFNTASLPDNAVIARVKLRVKQSDAPTGANPFSVLGALRVDIRKPYFGASAGLANSDFQATAGKANIGNIPNTPINNWYTRVWVADTFFSFINLTGVTQFRLYFATDDNNDNGADYMKFFSGNHATASVKPTIIIEYYIP